MNLDSRSKLIAIVVTVVIIIGLLLWYFGVFAPRSAPATPTTATAPAPAAQGLGSEVYEKSANPVSGKLPDAVAPVANPIKGAYKNPFQ